jgi:hypothetical protein
MSVLKLKFDQAEISKSAAGDGVPFSKFMSGELELYKFGEKVQIIFNQKVKVQQNYWLKAGHSSIALMEGSIPGCFCSVWVG